MSPQFDPTAWTAGLMGLFSLAAAIGALRKPGVWRTMIDEIDRSPALQLICGLAEIAIGAAIYLANPWNPNDVLTCIMKGMGGLMMLEALMVTGFSDIYFHLWLKNLAAAHRVWAVVTLLIGIGLSVAGFMRMA